MASKTKKPTVEGNAALIIEAVRSIPKGRVSTYGAIAELAGLPRRARLVGTVLRQTSSTRAVPWFRVINSSGRISFPLGSEAHARQKKKLEAEGVDFVGGRVNLRMFGWPPSVASLDEYLWTPEGDRSKPTRTRR
jgi:methylated-DNA-protein-cysteine methyltransferase-like protein